MILLFGCLKHRLHSFFVSLQFLRTLTAEVYIISPDIWLSSAARADIPSGLAASHRAPIAREAMVSSFLVSIRLYVVPQSLKVDIGVLLEHQNSILFYCILVHCSLWVFYHLLSASRTSECLREMVVVVGQFQFCLTILAFLTCGNSQSINNMYTQCCIFLERIQLIYPLFLSVSTGNLDLRFGERIGIDVMRILDYD